MKLNRQPFCVRSCMNLVVSQSRNVYVRRLSAAGCGGRAAGAGRPSQWESLPACVNRMLVPDLPPEGVLATENLGKPQVFPMPSKRLGRHFSILPPFSPYLIIHRSKTRGSRQKRLTGPGVSRKSYWPLCSRADSFAREDLMTR
jgi:hypothetical protein